MVSDILQKINTLKAERDAIILVHNYQLPEVQEIADYIGDSLELAKISTTIKACIILFCGVHFMAEMAKIFNPDKTVLLPDLHADCPMAHMITPERLIKMKKDHPAAAVVSYVNSTAEIKALSDICCTSANGVKVVKSLKEKEIIFVPDKYLGTFVARRVPDKQFHLCDGYCPSHMVFSREGISKLKKDYPAAKVVVHPECRLEVQDIADAVCSTSQMIDFARNDHAEQFIIGTEIGMIYRLKKELPHKVFIPANPNGLCPNMKLTTLEKILWALEDLKFELTIDEEIRRKALKAISRMIAL